MKNEIDDLADLLETYLDKRLSDIFVGAKGLIESFDQESMRANVKVLLKDENDYGDKKDFPVLTDLPVKFIWGGGFYFRPQYRRGDLVALGFDTYDPSDALEGRSGVKSENKFALQNAYVIGGILKTDSPFPTEFSQSGLLIGHEDGSVLIKMTETSVETKAGTDATEKAVLGETLIDWLESVIDILTNNAAAFTTNCVPGSPAGLAVAVVTALSAKKAALNTLLSKQVKHN